MGGNGRKCKERKWKEMKGKEQIEGKARKCKEILENNTNMDYEHERLGSNLCFGNAILCENYVKTYQMITHS